jgi:flagellin-specific chaperone FliS
MDDRNNKNIKFLQNFDADLDVIYSNFQKLYQFSIEELVMVDNSRFGPLKENIDFDSLYEEVDFIKELNVLKQLILSCYELIDICKKISFLQFFYKTAYKYKIDFHFPENDFPEKILLLFKYMVYECSDLELEIKHITRKQNADNIKKAKAQIQKLRKLNQKITNEIDNNLINFDKYEIEKIVIFTKDINNGKPTIQITIPNEFVDGVIDVNTIKLYFNPFFDFFSNDLKFKELESRDETGTKRKLVSSLVKFLYTYKRKRSEINNSDAALIFDFLVFCNLIPVPDLNEMDISSYEKHIYLRRYIDNLINTEYVP